MDKLRIGIIGLGVMGTGHTRYFNEGMINGAELTAVCDPRAERLEWARHHLGNIRCFKTVEEMYAADCMDGVIIATPHYAHPDQAIQALKQGLHVLIEKPAGVYTGQVEVMNEVATASGKVFGIMYNERANPLFCKLKELISSGELGELRRMNWIVTTWYRTQSYYDSGGWRATWAGEGGGVLINQAPHQLDLWQWTTGMMPKRIRAFCFCGKFRDIEVEDEVTAFAEYENGATGVFITTTAEYPGTNRFEIIGDHGKIVVEDNKMTFWRLRIPESQFNREHQLGSGKPEVWKFDLPVQGDEEHSHAKITQNWVHAIWKGTPLIAPGVEGIHGLMISNAMYLSAWTDEWVDLPIDGKLYYEKLQERIRQSKTTKDAAATQMS